jgi:hypothetical protein
MSTVRLSRPRRFSRALRASVRPLAAALVLANAVACGEDTPAQPSPLDRQSADVILAWNTTANEAITAHDGYGVPPTAVRLIAMMHLAQHDALNAVSPVWETYALKTSDAAADPRAAAAAAAHAVLVSAFPKQQAMLDQKLGTDLAGVPDGESETRGVVLGKQAAAAILERRANDGSDTPVVGDYRSGVGPGKYQFTAPFDFALLPGWRNLTPFALTRPDQFRPAPPPALASQAYADAFAEVKRMGMKGSGVRSADQTSYGKFWYEFSDIGWNRIGRVVAAERQLGLQATARLMALLNMAMSDAYVAGWDAKYSYDFWRPVTAIRAAGTDGNAATEADGAWESTEATPPVQDYPSTHAALGDASAEVLAAVLGDNTRFSFTSATADSASSSRSFTSFSAAADENADSRVMAGLHFRFSTDAGQELGRRIGRWTVEQHLRKR